MTQMTSHYDAHWCQWTLPIRDGTGQPTSCGPYPQLAPSLIAPSIPIGGGAGRSISCSPSFCPVPPQNGPSTQSRQGWPTNYLQPLPQASPTPDGPPRFFSSVPLLVKPSCFLTLSCSAAPNPAKPGAFSSALSLQHAWYTSLLSPHCCNNLFTFCLPLSLKAPQRNKWYAYHKAIE